ncbi:hypothetical protein QWM81_04990 [Streptomyces ficellus]|uniref:Uncharacterized protein n=1 Tax=Streptomyces ficellus TaxID=1977088 RepID=A0ABT7Z1N6_9ACTN|nr:hypothetical protein [Streptomyces ficellus]MDN3293404.1 hypothetical protein [Streptomyces ficellus]
MATRRTVLTAAAATAAATTLIGNSTATATAADIDATADAMTQDEARAAILAVNAGMRTRYKALKDALQNKLAPVIVVTNGPEGGTYYLVANGKVVEQTTPIDLIFQLAKSIAHTPLGTFSVIGSYLNKRVPDWHLKAGDMDPHDLEQVAFNGPEGTAWVEPLRQWKNELVKGRKALQWAGLPAKLETSSRNILNSMIAFCEKAITAQSFTMKDFEDATGAVYGDIRTNMYYAAKVQIAAVNQLMTRWKTKLGAALWHDVYVLVFSMWTTSVDNQNTIIIREHIDTDRRATHLIDIISDQLPVIDPVNVALENLARIVQDNIAAEMVFSTDQQVASSLKGKQDLLSEEILSQLGTTSTTGSATTAAFGTTGTGGGGCPLGHTAQA